MPAGLRLMLGWDLQAVVPEAEGPLCLDLELHLPAGELIVNDHESPTEP